MPRLKKTFALILSYLVPVLLLDWVFPYLVEPFPNNLNKKIFPYVSYPTNHRNYFDRMEDPEGRVYFGIKEEKESLESQPQSQGPRVITLGDSFTKGQGIRYKDSYPVQISLKSKSSFQVVNQGRGGTDVSEIAESLESTDPSLKPQWVVYGYVLNDPIKAQLSKDFTQIERTKANHGQDSTLKWDLINLRSQNIDFDLTLIPQLLSRYSNIARYIVHDYERHRLSEMTIQHYLDLHDPNKNKVGLPQTIDHIENMKRRSEEMGARFLVVIFPILFWNEKGYPIEQAHQNLRTLLEQRRIDFIDLTPFYRKFSAEELWVHPLDQHLNDLAHGIAAEQILNYIENNLGLECSLGGAGRDGECWF